MTPKRRKMPPRRPLQASPPSSRRAWHSRRSSSSNSNNSSSNPSNREDSNPMLNGAKSKKAVWSSVAILGVTVLVLSIAPTAHAANPVTDVIKLAGNVIGGAATLVPSIALAVVLYFLGVIGSTLVWVAGWVISFGVELNNNILSADNAAVRVGWGISRDLANLGFVLAIIFIAFLTILRSAGYDTKQMLTRLIVAALLVNFSLVIAGAFIDFAGVISGFFLSKISDSGGIGLSRQITAGFGAPT